MQGVPDTGMHRLFRIGMVLKGLNGFIECSLSLLFFWVSEARMMAIADFLIKDELAENPRDVFVRWFVDLAHHYSVGTQYFLIATLLIHGVVKIFLAVQLLREKRWAFPVALALFALILLSLVIRLLFVHFSAVLLFFICFEAAVIAFVWWEYRSLLRLGHIPRA